MPRWYIIPCCLLLISSSPPKGDGGDPLARALEAAETGDHVLAESFFHQAERTTSDPGLVAYNRGTWLLNKGEARAAEWEFQRVLDDRAITQDRQAKAYYNRGCALLLRGGSGATFRAAITSFEKCLEGNQNDAALRADAKHNLELAKLLWLKAQPKDAPAESPNAPGNDTSPPTPMTTPLQAPETTPSTTVGPTAKATPTEGPAPQVTPIPTDTKQAGTGNAPVLNDSATLQPLSPEDTAAYLKRIATRLVKDRRDTTRLVAGPDRKTVRDW